MGNGYRTPPGPGLEGLREELNEFRRRLAELESPTGTSMNSVLQQGIETARLAVIPVTLYRLDSPFVSSSVTEFAQISTPVPDGYTRALVSITAAAGLKSAQASGWATVLVSAGIQGTARNTMRNSIPAGLYGSVTTAASAVLTDLTPGSTIGVSAFASFGVEYTVPSVSVSGSILFLR